MRRRDKGFSLIELLIVVAIILIIAGMAIPNLLRSKIGPNEASAVASLRTLNDACVMYSTTYGGYPAALGNLATATAQNTQASSAAADMIPPDLATGTKSGYLFTYTKGETDPAGNVLTYSITAVPVVSGTTGQRSFYTDQSGLIRASSNGAATVANSPIP
jgi:type IV pilus assembly protein PilA